MIVTEPGVYDDIPEDVYHRDKATLSVSGAKKLLAPSCPAIFRWEQDNGQPPKRAFDVGHAAHAEVLGVGAELVVVRKTTRDKVVVDAEDYLTKSAQQHRDEIRAEGKTPLLAYEIRQVREMAVALRQHDLAAALFDPNRGKPEQSAYWRDEQHGVDRRCRFDWLPNTDSGRFIVPDYKTAIAVDHSAIKSAIAKFQYAMQSEWYLDAVRALGLAEDPAFVFVFQMKEPPYLVSVVQLDAQWERIGRQRNRQALEVYADCVATNRWPGFSDEVELIDPPRWALSKAEDVA